MRKLFLVAFVLVLAVALAPSAWAADDGNTQPKLSLGYTQYLNDYYKIVPTTSGAGNVKGIRCLNSSANMQVKIYVNGGSAQTITPVGLSTNAETLWIPMNVRFTTSIRVRMERLGGPSGYYDDECVVSWALD